MAKLDALIEAEKRGILPADKKPLLDEARKRGLVDQGGFTQDAINTIKSFAYNVPFGAGDLIKDTAASVAAAGLSHLDGGSPVSIPEAFTQARSDTAAEKAQMQQQTPIGTAAGELAGKMIAPAAIAGRVAAAVPNPKWITPELTNKLARLAHDNPKTTQAIAGGIFTGLDAIGSGKGTLGERLQEAGPIAAVGAALTPVAGAALSSLDKIVVPAVEKLKNFIAPKLANEAPAIDNALSKLIISLRQDHPDSAAFETALQEVANNPEKALVDIAGKKTATLAKGASQYPSGFENTQTFTQQRIAGSPDRIKQSIADNISPNSNFYDTIDQVVEAGQQKAAPLYSKYYAANKVVQSPEIDKILETPAGRKALKSAVALMQNDRSLVGLPDAELRGIKNDWFNINNLPDTGPVAAGLNARTLDYVKRALDDQIKPALGTNEGRILIGLKNDLTTALKTADKTARFGKPGAYEQALSTSGDYLSTKDAMEAGLRFTGRGAENAQQVERRLAEYTPAEKEAYKIGVTQALRQKIDDTALGKDTFNSIFNTPDIQRKLKAITTPEEFSKLSKTLKDEHKIYEFRNQTIGGSPTTPKAMAAREFGNEGEQILDTAARHGIRGVAVASIRGVIKRTFGSLNDDLANKVTTALYETNPVKKLALLKQINNQQNGRLALEAYFATDAKIRTLRSAYAGIQGVSPLTLGNAVGGALTQQDRSSQ